MKHTINTLFFLHFLVFLIFPLGFLIPSSIWSSRIEWHFWMMFGILFLFYGWGAVWTLTRRDKIYSVCILTTLMQSMRGYKLFDKNNYDHSFVRELFQRFHIHLKPGIVGTLSILFVLTGMFFYILKIYYGIILY